MKLKSFLMALVLLMLSLPAFTASRETGKTFDAQFLDRMTEHHRSGLEMARLAQSRAGDSHLKSMADIMVKDQQSEIQQMRKWRRDNYSQIPEIQSEELPKKMDMSELRTAKGHAFDKIFVEKMSEHHKNGIEMFNEAKEKATTEQIRQFASQGAKNQSEELKRLEEMKKTL